MKGVLGMDEHKTMELPVVDCCATCVWMRGWLDNMWCGKHTIGVLPYTKCDEFVRRPTMPLWVICDDEDVPHE